MSRSGKKTNRAPRDDRKTSTSGRPEADHRSRIHLGMKDDNGAPGHAVVVSLCAGARGTTKARPGAPFCPWGALAPYGRGIPFPASGNGQKGPPGRPGRAQGRAPNPSTRTNAANEGTKAHFWVGPHTPTPRTPPRMGGATQKCATAGAKWNPGATAPDHRRGWRRPRNERHHDYRREAAI